MKKPVRHLFLMLIMLASSMLASATPDYQESTSETLMGSNSEAYVVRKIERNNRGSYYSSQEKIFVDEYDKASGKLIKSTLLLDKKNVIDAGHSDPNTSPKVTTEIKHKDKTLSLADMYEKYPPINGSWQPDWYKEFTYTDYGISFKGHLLISTQTIEKLYKVSFNHGKAEPKILSIQFHGNSIYFKITTRRSEDGISNKIICLNPQKTKQVYAWANIQPIYLKVSSHDSLEEANLEALKIHKSLREKKKNSYTYTPLEIWSKRLKTDKVVYIIVLKNSSYVIKSNRVESYSEILSTPLVPIPSKGLKERWAPNEKLKSEGK